MWCLLVSLAQENRVWLLIPSMRKASDDMWRAYHPMHRQFLGRLDKPKVDKIEGLAPAIAIEQKVNSTNPRSTVGTTTEIYDYLKLLFARIGTTYSPISNEVVTKDSVSDILDQIKSHEDGTKLIVLAPIHIDQNRSMDQILNLFEQQGYARIQVNGEIVRISEIKDNPFLIAIWSLIESFLKKMRMPKSIGRLVRNRIF